MLIEALSEKFNLALKDFEYIWTSIVFGILGTVFSPRNRTAVGYIVSFSAAVPIGYLAGIASDTYITDPDMVKLCIAFASLTAQDLLRFVFKLTGFINDNSTTIFNIILDKLRKK